MDPGTNALVAALVAACAVLVACAAVVVVLLGRAVGGRSSQAGGRFRRATSVVALEAPTARRRLKAAADRVDALHQSGAASDRVLDGLTGSLADMRGAIEGMTQGRLARLIRTASLVSRAAQVALLWR